MSTKENLWDDAEIIHRYTRAQALDDGFLIDVTETAREAGFMWPVAMTTAVWQDCVAWNEEDTKRQTPQDESGRLWDVLFMASRAIKAARHNGTRLSFHVLRIPRGGKARTPRGVALHLVTGPGDDAEPVVTIMQPGED